MIKTSLLVSLLVVIFSASLTSAQEPDLSWLKSHSAVPNEPLQARTDNYSIFELGRFRTLLDSLKSAPETTEWDGFYVSGGADAVGFSSLRLRLKVGFASLYIYTCTPELRNIDYGTVRETSDAIVLTREVPNGSPRKQETIKFIKVRWADSRFLVSERVLGVFAEKAVGTFVIPDEGTNESQEWWNFWEMGNFDRKLTGRPQFPVNYRHLERSAIEATIVDVQPRRIVSEFSTPRSYHGGESAVYKVILSVGTNYRVKKGISLKILGSSEEVVITSVSRTTSQGVLVRTINDSSREDHCLNDDGEVIQCPKLTKGIKISTEVGNLLF